MVTKQHRFPLHIPETYHLVGATDPPCDTSTRRTRNINKNSSFLRGVTNDLATMEASKKVKKGLYNAVRDYYLEKDEARAKIKKFFSICKGDGSKPILYYTGHGQVGTGDWCFSDGTLSIQEIEEDVPRGCLYPLIISDACYSGRWANYCRAEELPGFECLAASPEFSAAYDSDTGKGGELTLWMNGKAGRPSTEPLYSAKSRDPPYNITPGYEKSHYVDLLGSEMKNTKQLLISQSIENGKISAIFAEDSRYKPRPALSWVNRDDHDGFLRYIEDERRSKGKHVFSMACDDYFGFGVFTMKDFGTDQDITWDPDMSTVQQWYDKRYRITACGARNSTFYYIMTRGAKGYDKKNQICKIKDSWQEADEYIRQQWEDGKLLTGICYSTGLKQYLLVMTESSGEQSYSWGTSSQIVDFDWVEEEYDRGLSPTIIFHDPSSDRVLVVMTSDSNRSGYIIRQMHGLIR